GVDRETARGKTELPRVAGARAEVARAEKDCDVVPPVRRGMHAKAGERQVRGQLARVDGAAVELEHVGAVTYRARFAADELEQLDRLFEAAAAMEKFQAKRALRLRPERVIVPKADRLILVVRQLAQELRCELFRRSVRRAGQRTRTPLQRGEIERVSASSQPRSRECRKHQGGLQK